MAVIERMRSAWNAFVNQEPDHIQSYGDYGVSYARRPDATRMSMTNEGSIIGAVYNRISLDAAAVDIRHVKLDDNDRYLETVNSGLNNCFSLEANIDQRARQFKQDIFMQMFNEGHIVLVPIDTDLDPEQTSGYDIRTMRIGKVVTWFPEHVTVSVYNEKISRRQEITVKKRQVCIVINPLYAVMNETNSTLQRLIRKLNYLDAIDEQSASGKLDLIIQLPYVIKSEARRQQAQERKIALEDQMRGSKYGIGYVDATEKITQLNRPAENNMLKQVEWLTEKLYGELGVTPEVINGTADERTMINYFNRTIEPLLTSVVEGMRASFLTKTARTQKQSIVFFRDPFKLLTITDIAEVGDKLTRNEILSSNELRGVLGFRPSTDPRADQLVNKNIPEPIPETQDLGELTPAGGSQVKTPPILEITK